MPEGDAGCLVNLLKTHYGRLFSYILKMIPNYSDAEDVMQEVVSVLWKKKADYVPNTDFLAWALEVARLKVYEHYKDSKRGRNQLSGETVRLLHEETLSDRTCNAHLDAVRQCISRLTLQDYRFIHLRYELNETVSSMARKFGCSVQNVYQRLSRIHNLLLVCVKRQLYQGEQ